MPNLRKQNRDLLQLLGSIHADLLMRAEMNAHRPDRDGEVVVELGNGVWSRLCEAVNQKPEILGLPQDPGKLPNHHKQWFEQLKKACADGNLALMSCLDAKTMEARSVLTLVGHDNGMFVMTPVGHLCPEDNPYEAYLPPSNEQDTIQ